uniref:Uncharacterized protein n=1 Tax=Anopheles quadriannulatus TaxID=34691 RepID=A0A182XRZ6_ANOQN
MMCREKYGSLQPVSWTAGMCFWRGIYTTNGHIVGTKLGIVGIIPTTKPTDD